MPTFTVPKPSNLNGLTDWFKKLKLDGVDDGQDNDQVHSAAFFPADATENGEAGLSRNGLLLDSLLQEDKFSR